MIIARRATRGLAYVLCMTGSVVAYIGRTDADCYDRK